MGLFDKLRGELVDIIEWLDDSHHTLVWRFPRYQNEIKNGAQLIVRPGQVAIFVHQGELADVFEEGRHELSTGNMPIMSTLQGWKHGFNSPFRSEVYFVSTRQITDLKWGTPNPIMLRDPEFGPIRLRAFGTYALKAMDPKIIVRELVGTDGHFDASEVTELLRSIIISSFTDILGESNTSALDLATKYNEMSEGLRLAACEKIDDEYGLEIPNLQIVNISLPEAVEKALDTRTSMGVLGDMGRYQQYQMANAMGASGEQPGGGMMGEAMGMGMGVAMAGQMMNQMNQAMRPGMGGGMMPPQAPGMMPPPPPVQSLWHVSVGGQNMGPFNLQQLQGMAAQGQVNAQSMVWTQGMAGWQAAGQVPQLSALFGAPPPPPPAPVG